MKSLSGMLLVVFLTTAVALSPRFSRGSETVYTVEGRLEYRAIFPRKTREISFVVAVSNCAWSIVGVSSENQEITSKQVYDGQILTSAVRFPDRVRSQSTIGNDSTLGVESNDMPNSLSDIGAGQIWLAYASACKFSGSTTGLTELVWFVSQELRRDHFKTPTAWMIEPQEPFLPSKVDYYFNSDAFQRAIAGKQMSPSGIGNTAVLTKWASYRVTSFTNTGSISLPRSFYFEAFEPSMSPDRPSTLAYSYRGMLTTVYESVPANAFVHGLGTKTLVQDERMMNPTNPASYIRYVTTTNDIPSTSSLEMIAAADFANRTQLAWQPAPTLWRTIKNWVHRPSAPAPKRPAAQSSPTRTNAAPIK